MRELAILIEAAPGPGGAAAQAGPGGPARRDLVRHLAPRRLYCGYGRAGERLRAELACPDGHVPPEEARALGGLLAWAPELAALDGDLLVLPGGCAGPTPADLATMRELHEAEGNAATLLAEGDSGPGAPARDALGRVTGPGQAAGISLLHLPDLVAARGAGAEVEDVAAALALLRAAGRPLGAYRTAAHAGGCPRCLATTAADPESGLLAVNDRAYLAVEHPGFNSGQLVCCPRRHVTCGLSLTAAERDDLAALMREGERLARAVYRYDALNLGFSSGTGAHLAVQLIPRWTGDLNFLPLVSGFKAVPEKPSEAWRRYREAQA